MQSLLPIGLVIAGFVLGTLIFSRVGHWLLGIYGVISGRDGSGSLSIAKLAPVVFLASGPWVLIATAVFAFNVRGEWWSIWLFGGVCMALAYFSALSVYLARKAAASAGTKHAG